MRASTISVLADAVTLVQDHRLCMAAIPQPYDPHCCFSEACVTEVSISIRNAETRLSII